LSFCFLRKISAACLIALLATMAAKTLQFVGEYIVLGDLFIKHGLMSFIFPGTIVMIGAGILANTIMITNRAMSFDNVLKTYAIIGLVASAIFITQSVVTEAPMLMKMVELFGNKEQHLFLCVVLLIPISAVPIVTYIFVTNWAALWLAKVFRLTIA